MKRREFIQLSGAYLIGGSTIILPQQADAFWPWIARFFFRGVVRTGARSAARSSLRGAASGAARRSAFESIAKVGIVSGSLVSVSTSLFADINKYKAKAIWVNEGVENNFTLALSNRLSQTISGQLGYELRDIDSGDVELRRQVGYVSSPPRDQFKFDFSISDLPYLGAKRLQAVTDSRDLYCEPSAPIIVTQQSEVRFNDES